jgi:hypothetical protein
MGETIDVGFLIHDRHKVCLLTGASQGGLHLRA